MPTSSPYSTPASPKAFQVALVKLVDYLKEEIYQSFYHIHSKDYCHNPRHAEASVYAASVNLMIRRLA